MKFRLLRGLENSIRKIRRDVFRGDLFRKERDESVRDALFSLGERGYLLVRPCGDYRIALDPSDEFIGSVVMTHGDWQRAETVRAIEYLASRDMLPSRSVFVDIGANIGTQSIYALLSGRFDRVLALEPSPAHFDQLTLNMYMNGFLDQSVCRRTAAGSRAEQMVLSLDPVNKGNNRLTRECGAAGLVVSVERLDDILHAENIPLAEVGLVWMDVQGHEPEAVEGMAGVLDAEVPLVIEFNSGDYGPGRTRRFIDVLKRHYDRFILIGEEQPVAHSLDWLERISIMNDVLVFRDRPQAGARQAVR